MKALLIKTSSMGDLIHTLPAVTDAVTAIPGLRFDWVVEEPYVEIPNWHPAVDKVIPIALRRWRKSLLSASTRQALRDLRQEFRLGQYDIVLDAQALIKSALITLLAPGLRVGLDWKSAREPLASLAYQRKCTVNFYQHAIVRMRSLFSQAFGYPTPSAPPEFALKRSALRESHDEKYLVFLHGTTWATKQWPEEYWKELAALAAQEGYRIKIGGGNEEEVQRATRIADSLGQVDVLPYLNIGKMAKLLANSCGVVAVDTGFGHLAAALDVPTVSLYSSTNPEFTGALGCQSMHLAVDFPCAPCLGRNCSYTKSAPVKPACYTTLTPRQVWQTVSDMLAATNRRYASS